jgi:hypothetical protein
VAVGTIVHDSNGAIRLGDVSGSVGATGRGSLIGDRKDGPSGVNSLERRGTGRDYGELKLDGGGSVPPLGLEGSLIRTGGKVDIVPGMNARRAGLSGVEVYVGVG